MASPDRNYGWWGKLSFAWVNEPIKRARKEQLDLDSLYLPQVCTRPRLRHNAKHTTHAAGKAACLHPLSARECVQEAHADNCYDDFERAWAHRTADHERLPSRPLFRTLSSLYGKRFLVGGLFKLAWSTLVIAGAFFFVRSLLRFVDEEDQDHPFTEEWKGWILAFFFFVSATVWGALSGPQTLTCTARAAPR